MCEGGGPRILPPHIEDRARGVGQDSMDNAHSPFVDQSSLWVRVWCQHWGEVGRPGGIDRQDKGRF